MYFKMSSADVLPDVYFLFFLSSEKKKKNSEIQGKNSEISVFTLNI